MLSALFPSGWQTPRTGPGPQVSPEYHGMNGAHKHSFNERQLRHLSGAPSSGADRRCDMGAVSSPRTAADPWLPGFSSVSERVPRGPPWDSPLRHSGCLALPLPHSISGCMSGGKGRRCREWLTGIVGRDASLATRTASRQTPCVSTSVSSHHHILGRGAWTRG